MALPDVPDTYRFTLFMSFFGEECINVFHYRDAIPPAFDPVDAANGFWQKIKVPFRAFLFSTSSVIYVEVLCEQLFGDHAFGVFPVPLAEQAGSRVTVSDWMPSTLAAQVKLNVGTRLTRPGSKRLWGLREEDVTELNLTAGAVGLYGAAAAVLDDPFSPAGSLSELTPVIVGYPTPALPGSPRVQDVVSAVLSPYVSHQVSRDRRPT